jgi:hypothetical protein
MMYDYAAAFTLTHGEQLYADLLGDLERNQELQDAMWADAESSFAELDVPGTHWTVTLLADGTPAAWAAARFTEDGSIQCRNNYERREHRGHGLYEVAYHARHRDILLAYKLPAFTYLFADPIALHERDGWYKTGEEGPGELPGNHWYQLRRN